MMLGRNILLSKGNWMCKGPGVGMAAPGTLEDERGLEWRSRVRRRGRKRLHGGRAVHETQEPGLDLRSEELRAASEQGGRGQTHISDQIFLAAVGIGESM